jgi:hypothetical protein
MGDTFTNQSIERGYSFAGGTDGFGFSGFSEQEPIVIGSYDEAVPATSPDLPSGARARPIVVVPSATPAYAAMQSDRHSFDGRDGLHLQGGGNYIAVMGISFLAAQRNPSDGAYVGLGNVADNLGVDHRGGQTGSLIEDSRASWFFAGFAFENLSGSSAVRSNFDVNIRRSQADHCYQQHGGHSIGFVVDSVGAIGGAISPGFTFEENVIDLCGYANPALTTGDSLSRNAYLQWDSVFGYRRGNTSTRSASEDIQFRSGGVIDNNFMYNGSYGFDVGHNEGFPTLASNTVVTNNVVLTTDSPFAVGYGLGINFLNSNGVTASGNIIAHYDPTVGAFGYFAQTDAYNGNVDFTTITNAGTGGTPGDYALGSGIACAGSPTNFTGGSSPSISIFAMNIGAGGTITPDPGTGGLTFIEPSAGQTYNVGDVLTPVAGYPSINTTGTSLTAVGTGGTLGDYGTTFGHCSRDAGRPLSGDTQAGVALTNFSGSMAGSGAVGTFTLNSFTSVTRALVGGTYIATGITTNTNTINDLFSGVGTKKFTVTGAVPSAYNGTWTLAPGTSATQIVWDLGTAVDPGPVTTPGNVTAFAIIATGAAYQAGDVLTAASGDVGGQTGIRLTVGTVAHLSGWVITVDTIDSSGVHGLTWTNNVVFNWPPGGPTAVPGVDAGGTHDSPGGIPGSGTANTWTGNSNCAGAQFTGVITGTNTLTTSALVQGTIAIGQNLAGASVMASTTITGGSGTSWTVSPNQTAPSETMYSYTCTPTVVYSHPEQTMVTYAASLGLTASIDGYMNAALANARWNWDPALTANNGINPYIRLGFQ